LEEKMTKEIQLTQGKFALVDDEDYNYLIQWKWTFFKSTDEHNGYACIRDKKTGKIIFMHSVLIPTPIGMQVDHINTIKSDNRRCNLRLATRSQNNANRKRYRKNRIGKYKGTRFDKRYNTWSAYITFNKKQIHLGTFKNEEDAALVYNEKAIELFGEFALLNVICKTC